MIEFTNNNVLFSIINLFSFFINKDFYSKISFNSDIIKYKIIRKRLNAIKIKNIINYIKNVL